MSALNATTYSASRVSFAMGRDRNLPGFFSVVHPERHTPYGAVLASGALMLLMALALPLEDVAAAADIMFLLLFIQVNVALIRIRRNGERVGGGFRSPLFPLLPTLAIAANAGLAVYLVVFSQSAWLFTILWLAIGVITYSTYFARKPAMAAPNGVILEEVKVSRKYSVLVPVADSRQGRTLGAYGAQLAAVRQGEVLALHVIHVPPQLPLTQGRLFLDEARAVLDSLAVQAERRGVPVHRIVRLGRNPSEAVRQTAHENGSDLILLGWEGFTRSSGRLFGSVIDPIVDNPPADVAVLRARRLDGVHRVLVPVAGGPNSRLAVSIAAQLVADRRDEAVEVAVVHIVPTGADDAERVRAKQVFDYCLQGIDDPSIRTAIIEADAVGDAIVTEADKHDLVVIGATDEPLFKNILAGTLPAWVARHSPVSVLMVKRRSSRLQSMVRRTLLKRPQAQQRAPDGTGV
jgi:APA family basic amino acid/polyamine antiporter